jgi:hypothetical protein
MKWAAAIGFLAAFLALPTLAQVEIRGITVAPSHQPGNGGIILKGVISTRLPGKISGIRPHFSDVVAEVDKAQMLMFVRNGQLFQEPITLPRRRGSFEMFYRNAIDLDGDGKEETIEFDKSGPQGRLIVTRREGNSTREVASLAGFSSRQYTHFTDLTRSGRQQIVAIDANNCLRVLSFADDKLNDLGSLSCGAPLIGDPLITDIDQNTYTDIIVAREPDRIEIFLR